MGTVRKLALILALISFSPLPAAAGDISVFAAYAGFDGQGDGYGLNLKGGFPILEALELEMRGGYYDNVAKSNLPAVELIPLEMGLALNVPVRPAFHPLRKRRRRLLLF